jgi:hypothetical protein
MVSLATVGAPLSLCSCGSGRSVAAYCETFYRQGTALRDQWAGSSNRDPLDALLTLFEAPQQLELFFARLDSVAPGSIEPDVAAVQQAFKQEVSSLGSAATNPLGGILGGLVSGIANAPAFQAVDNWTSQNCGPPPGTKWLSGDSG